MRPSLAMPADLVAVLRRSASRMAIFSALVAKQYPGDSGFGDLAASMETLHRSVEEMVERWAAEGDGEYTLEASWRRARELGLLSKRYTFDVKELRKKLQEMLDRKTRYRPCKFSVSTVRFGSL